MHIVANAGAPGMGRDFHLFLFFYFFTFFILCDFCKSSSSQGGFSFNFLLDTEWRWRRLPMVIYSTVNLCDRVFICVNIVRDEV